MKKLHAFAAIVLIWANGFSQINGCFPNPRIWIRADRPGVTGTQWQDQSGNGYHATVQNNAALPDTTLFNYMENAVKLTTLSRFKVTPRIAGKSDPPRGAN